MKNKKIILIAAALSSVISLASCGGSGGSTGGGGSTSGDIVFWHCIGHEKFNNLQKVIEKFNADHEGGFQIKAEKIAGSYDDLHDMVKTKLQAGQMPAITMGYPDSFSEYMTKNESTSQILKLDSYIQADSDFNADDMVDMYYKEGQNYQFEGTWSVPLYKSTEAMYYNIGAFKATQYYKDNVGKTVTRKDVDGNDYVVKLDDPSTWDWEQLVTAGKAIQVEKSGVSDFHAIGYDSDANLFISQMAQRGIDYTTATGQSYEHFKFYDNTNLTADTKLIEFAKEIFELTTGSDSTGTGSVLVTQASYGSYASTLFLQEKVMFTIGSTGGSSYNDPKGGWTEGVGLCSVPAYKNNKKYIMQGPSLCFFDLKDEGKQQAAWEFYSKYLSNAEDNAAVALENSYDPVRDSSYTTTNYTNWCSLGYKTGTTEDNPTALLQYRIPNLTKTLTQYYMTSPVFIGSSAARTNIGKIVTRMREQVEKDAKTITDDQVNAAIKAIYQACVIAAQ